MVTWKKRIRRSWWLWALGKTWLWLLLAVWVVSVKVGLVTGPSMEPTLHTGDVLLIIRWLEPREGDIVIARAPGIRQPVCKRVVCISQEGYYLLGDNSAVSMDSRDFGSLEKDSIIGVSVAEIRLGGLFVCAKSFLS